ncbi:hypothetical protein BGZ95_005930 [Linnemannia exigua]|uniref:FAD-binding domain-containing protein n=1 Tax=Linnemannia exigua TaxID=604196 RepID=A0AAD4DGH8_9FUNG|nr:hypothetical protein BGZ95_005930 [Linnemannia exigua]
MIQQLGLLEEFKAMAKENDVVSNFNEDMELTSTVVYTEFPERTGYPNYCIARPRLYDLLYSQIPSEKVHMGKRFETFSSDDDGVLITFTDKTTIQGSILVGADGAYSAVRKNMFAQLDEKGVLPISDKEELPCSSICLVGQTKAGLSVEKFPYLKEKLCRFENVTGKDKPYTWLTFCMPDNSICWMVIEHLYLETNREEIAANNAEWGPGSTEAMIEKVKHFPIPSGGASNPTLTLADLIDETPREYISQVALEGKMYPSAAQGANAAIQDAIVLSNYLYAMRDANPETITHAFGQYRQERFASARQAHDTSERFRQLFRKRWINGIIRLMVRYIPQMVWNRIFDKVYSNRPQVAFLPLVEDRGTVKAFPQQSLHLSNGTEE